MKPPHNTDHRSLLPLTESQRELVTSNIRLAYKFASMWSGPKDDHDEMISACMDALVRASQTYDPSIGRFSTYVAMWCKQRIQKYRKERDADKLVTVGGLESSPIDFAQSRDQFDLVDERDAFETRIACLSPSGQEVMRKLFVEGHDFRKLNRQTRQTRYKFTRLYLFCLNKIRRRLCQS